MGFEWMDCQRPQTSTISWIRRGKTARKQLLFITNFTPVAHTKYRCKAPCKGRFKEILNSDEERFGGQGRVNPDPITAEKARVKDSKGKEIDGFEIELYLAPLTTLVLEYDYKE